MILLNAHDARMWLRLGMPRWNVYVMERLGGPVVTLAAWAG